MFYDKKFEVAKAIIQAEIIAESLKPTAIPTFSLPSGFKKFSNPDQRKVVPAGKKEIVYSNNLSSGRVGIATKIAITYYIGDYIYIYVDGLTLEGNPIERAIGSYPNTPLRTFLKFYSEIRVEVQNNDTSDHEYGALIDGWEADKKDEDKLVEMILRGGL
jgi:hypothetical protein